MKGGYSVTLRDLRRYAAGMLGEACYVLVLAAVGLAIAVVAALLS